VAGTGLAGYVADQVPASSAPLNSPMGVAVDMWGDVFIADTSSQRIRDVGADGIIRDYAGGGASGLGPAGAPPQQTALNAPRGICFDRAGTVFIVDTSNNRVLRVPMGGPVLTAAGNGLAGYTGDGGGAQLAKLNQPAACAVDTAGNLFIADTGNHTIRKVTPDATIHTVAGSGAAGLSGDEGPAVAAQLQGSRGVAVDDNGDIFIADTGNNSIRQVTPDGLIHTIAGQAAAGFGGDGGPAASAQLNGPQGLALDGSGDLYFADTNNNRVRQLQPQAAALPATQPPGGSPSPPVVSAVNAASLVAGPVAPGEILVINGTGIGPPASVTGVYDSNGMLPTQAGGAQVLFDGVAAPVLSAQASQITVQAPYTIAGNQSTSVVVQYKGQPTGSVTLAVASAAPGLFPLVTNQDGSANSAASPAPRGSIVTFYETGEGLTSGPNVAGLAAQAPYAVPLLPVSLTVAGVSAGADYVGSAPGLVGTLQINARIPGGFVPPGQVAVMLTVGAVISPPISIWVQ